MNNHSPVKISILMPSYNPGAHILDAVWSIKNQTFLDWELLILDDGSTDDSLNLINNITDSRIKIITEKKNRGLSYRLNQGITLAKGMYIARMDADDISFPDRLEKQFKFLLDNPHVDLVASRVLAFKDTSFSLIGLLPFFNEHHKIISSPWRSIPMPHPSWMAKSTWFRKYKYLIPEVRRCEDQELLLRSYPDSQFYCLPNVLLAYRQGPFNLSKILISRKYLLKVQVKYFFKRRQFSFLVKSFFIFLLKVFFDFFSALPGLNFIFFYRMRGKIPINLIRQFENILGNLRGR